MKRFERLINSIHCRGSNILFIWLTKIALFLSLRIEWRIGVLSSAEIKIAVAGAWPTGCSINGSEPFVYAGTRFRHPKIPDEQPSVQSELLAFGSTLYEIETTRQPYQGLSHDKVEKLYSNGIFPDIRGLIFEDVIRNCWHLQYSDSAETSRDILRISQSLPLAIPDGGLRERNENLPQKRWTRQAQFSLS